MIFLCPNFRAKKYPHGAGWENAMAATESNQISDVGGVKRSGLAIGLDFSNGAPSKEFVHAAICFHEGGDVRHFADAFLYIGNELRIGGLKLAWKGGKKPLVFVLRDEENELLLQHC
jgi:hypothetical protein